MKNPKAPKPSKYFEDINAFNKLKNSQGSDFYGDRPDVTVQDLFRGPEYLFDGKEFLLESVNHESAEENVQSKRP